MARKLLIFTLVVAFFTATVVGAEANTQNVWDGIIKSAENFLNNVLKTLQDVIRRAQQFIDGAKQKIRQEEDNLLNQVPSPLGDLLKNILHRIHDAEDKQAQLGVNMTECVINEAKPAFDAVNASMEELRSCVDGSTKDISATISDFEDLLKQAVSLAGSAPGQLMPCIKFPPTSETWSCVTSKVQELSSKALLLASSLISDMGTIARDVPKVIQAMVTCGLEERYEAEKKLGAIIENIGNCEKQVVQNSK